MSIRTSFGLTTQPSFSLPTLLQRDLSSSGQLESPPSPTLPAPLVLGAAVQAAGATLDAATATPAMVVAAAQVVVVVSTPGVPGPVFELTYLLMDSIKKQCLALPNDPFNGL